MREITDKDIARGLESDEYNELMDEERRKDGAEEPDDYDNPDGHDESHDAGDFEGL